MTMAAEIEIEESSSSTKSGSTVKLPENRFALELEFGKYGMSAATLA
jgi:hypothetical protein